MHGIHLIGRPSEEVWYFAYGANMDDQTFGVRRGIRPLRRGVGRVAGYRLRFNLEGRPKGKAAPANLYPDPDGEIWGVFYRITRRDLMRLDATEGVPGPGYRHAIVSVDARDGERFDAVTYIAQGNEEDGKPSLRYITLIRNGAKANCLPGDYIRFLESVEPTA